jgi:hypothetical protein
MLTLILCLIINILKIENNENDKISRVEYTDKDIFRIH